jgi:SAM-dependent methyltransferase
MDFSPACPVCGQCSWCNFDSYTFKRHHNIREPYFAYRRDALFDVWFPDLTEVTLRGAYCEVCGFITYLPRPTTSDISNKYAYLARREGKNSPARSDFVNSLEDRRSNRLRRTTFRFAPNPERVLDFGGGDGHLMSSFLSAGSKCFLVDYSASSIPGVSKLGDTLQEIDKSAADFNLIICSHVIEHLSDPASTLRDLRSRAAPGAVLYCEVPFELARGLRLETDPVTHINFFTKESLEALLALTGWRPLRTRYLSTTYWSLPMRVCYGIAEASSSEIPSPHVRTTSPTWIRRTSKQTARASLIALDTRARFVLSALSVKLRALLPKPAAQKGPTSNKNDSG